MTYWINYTKIPDIAKKNKNNYKYYRTVTKFKDTQNRNNEKITSSKATMLFGKNKINQNNSTDN